MNKEETLLALEKAKKLHMLEMEKIVTLIDGDNIDNPPAINKMECEFGKILYGNKEEFAHILGSQFWDRMDCLHEKWHQEYVKINDIFFKEKKSKGFLSKLLGSSKIDPLEYDKAKLYHAELGVTTKELLHLLDSCTRRVIALNDSKFEY